LDYDADGRVTRMGSTTDGDEVSYVIDAAGQIEQNTATGQDRSNMSYDGDGRMTVQTKYHWLTATSVFNTVPTSDNLFIRSSVLNGTVVSEAMGASSGSDAGKMWRTFIRAGGTELARLVKGGGFLADAVYWPITDPAQESYRLTDANGDLAGSYLSLESAKEMNPAGADVKPWNPYDIANPPLEGFPDSSALTPFAASPVYPRVTYSIDGLLVDRDFYLQFAFWERTSPFPRIVTTVVSSHLVGDDPENDEVETIRHVLSGSAGLVRLLSAQDFPKISGESLEEIRTGIKALLKNNKKCKDFLESLSAVIGEGDHGYKKNILDLFNHIAKKGGFYDSSSDSSAAPGYTAAGADQDKPRIEMNISSLNAINPEAILFALVHELTHANKKGGGRFTHTQMAFAAVQAYKKMGLVDLFDVPQKAPFFDLGTTDKNTRDNALLPIDTHNSKAFNDRLFDACFRE
jgi:hypothetical protein